MAADGPYSRRDGETIRLLPSGLEIVRRKKHEPIDQSGLSREEWARQTDKRNGSKFSEAWNLERLVDFIAVRVTGLGWRKGIAQEVTIPTHENVGWVKAKPVRAIKIVSDGRYVHAYPVEG